MTQLNAVAAKLKLIAMDVDGVLTTGAVTYDSNGLEHKSFCIKDGLGIKLLQKAGLRVALITGRASPMVERRAAELGITDVIQGREDKLTALKEMTALVGCTLEEAAYMGDDLPDLAVIRRVGLGITPANGRVTVAEQAHWQTSNCGGQGAVREVAEMILEAQGKLQPILATFQ